MWCLRRHYFWEVPASLVSAKLRAFSGMESFGRHTQFLLKQGGVCVKDVSVTKSVCCSCRWSGLWVSAPTLGGSQIPATPLGSNTLWSPQVPACTWHIETQRYISTYIKEKKSIKGKILFIFMLFCSCSLYPILCCESPASRGMTDDSSLCPHYSSAFI